MSRELDAQIAERVMGHAVTLDGLGARSFVVKSHRDEAGVLDLLPAYSTDLNACATAEARIISMGLDWSYENKMRALMPDDMTPALWYLTASAEARCRAMLATLEGK